MKTIITLDNNKNVLYYKDSNISWSKTYKDNILIQYNDSIGNYWDNTIGIDNPYDILSKIHVIPIWNIINYLITIQYNLNPDAYKGCGMEYINGMIKGKFKGKEDLILDAYLFKCTFDGIGLSKERKIINGRRCIKYFSKIIYFRI
jgi:hypothetical protein